jgi:hypothetical protein
MSSRILHNKKISFWTLWIWSNLAFSPQIKAIIQWAIILSFHSSLEALFFLPLQHNDSLQNSYPSFLLLKLLLFIQTNRGFLRIKSLISASLKWRWRFTLMIINYVLFPTKSAFHHNFPLINHIYAICFL